MAVPTFSSVTPATGPTRGDMLVRIAGTNFRVPTIPASGETDHKLKVTVAVTIGGTAAARVDVLSSSALDVLLPVHDPGLVAITIQNLDDAGAAIVGESVTANNAFTFELPKYTAEHESDLLRCVRTLLRELKRQTLAEEVNLAVETDYDEATGDALNVTKFSKLPGIALVGPDLSENRFYSLNEKPTVPIAPADPDSDFVETRVPMTVDLAFELIGVSDKKGELLNLMTSVVQFFHRNKWLRMERIAGDPSKGIIQHEMDFARDGLPKMGRTPNGSNVRQFSAMFVIRGFDIEDLAGLTAGLEPGTAVLRPSIVKRGRTLVDPVSLDHPEKKP